MERVLTRARETGIKFNREKCKFKQTEIKYVGHLISKEGIKVDPHKVRAIQEIKLPKKRKRITTIFGYVNVRV